MKHIANILTFGRIAMSTALLFVPCFSRRFYILYLLAGFTDMIDGTAARLTKSASPMGAKLDSIADALFTLVCVIKLARVLELSPVIITIAGLIAVVKCVNYALLRRKKLSPELLHSKLSKLTGLLLFFLPLTNGYINVSISAAVVCAFAAVSAVYERYIIFWTF